MPFALLYPKTIQKYFWKTIDFVKNLEMTQIAGGGAHVLCVLMTQCVRKSICDSPRILESLAKLSNILGFTPKKKIKLW